MKVAKKWLSELVELNVSIDEVVKLLPLRTIATKEVNDQFIELDMKGYNRADLLSMRGVAYEVAAITDSKVTFTEGETSLEDKGSLNIQIEDSNDCPVYYLLKIQGLKVGKSPEEWVKRLEDCGMRSVNNVADVTNLVMLEYGQPLHAFNAAFVDNETICVRRAQSGEKLLTLDGKERDLENNDILITDPKKILGLAGVMGGKESEIPESGEINVLLEGAIFDPIALRKTATHLGLISEASKRFYHGLTQTRLIQALNAAIKYYEELGGVVVAIAHKGGKSDEVKKVNTRLEKVNQLIGVDFTENEVEDYLTKLYFKLEKTDDGCLVTPPYWRGDVELEEDVIEEVARMYGYEKIPAKPLQGEVPEKIDQSLFELIKNVKTDLVKLGLTEVQTYSFYSTQVLNGLGFNEDNKNILIKVKNPISAETEYMRMNLWPNLIEAVAKNHRQGFEDIAIFEIGKVYEKQSDNLPKETYRLSIALMNGSDNPAEELSAIIRRLDSDLGLNIEYGQKIDGRAAQALYHPTRTQQYTKDGQLLGGIAEVHPRVLNRFGEQSRVAIAEINLQ